eukprot:XP_001697033.1 predicted protein [Chlamydomonas reinhardtii]
MDTPVAIIDQQADVERQYKDELRWMQKLEEIKELSGTSAASVAALRSKLSTTDSELSELQTQYQRIVYEHAKARAEHTEMSGKLLRVGAAGVGGRGVRLSGL